MEEDRNIIERDLGTLVFYMQGGLTLQDAYMLNEFQIKLYSDVIKKHYDAQNATGSNTKSR